MGRRLEKVLHDAALRQWRRAAADAEAMALPRLRAQRNRARTLKTEIERLLHVADGRLTVPEIGSQRFPRPHGTDWAWRPDAWRGPLASPGLCPVPDATDVGGGTKIFHDGDGAEIALRQRRNRSETDLAAFGLQIDLFHFTGTFLSIVIDLPDEASTGLSKSHLLRMDCRIKTEAPVTCYARLNIRHGPNTEQITRELAVTPDGGSVEFDLAYCQLDERRVDRLWLDLILEAPDMNCAVIRDLTLARAFRAPL